MPRRRRPKENINIVSLTSGHTSKKKDIFCLFLFSEIFHQVCGFCAPDKSRVSNCCKFCVKQKKWMGFFFSLNTVHISMLQTGLTTTSCPNRNQGWCHWLICCANVTFTIALQSLIHLTSNVCGSLSCRPATVSTPIQDGWLTAWCVLDIQREARMPVR